MYICTYVRIYVRTYVMQPGSSNSERGLRVAAQTWAVPAYVFCVPERQVFCSPSCRPVPFQRLASGPRGTPSLVLQEIRR